jgi:1,4-dihydroxy-2-naphthoyl-CoA hydrolase
MQPPAWLQLKRRVRFGDTDAAGVMHFHQLLRWCHEAWEESLEHYGVAPSSIFPGSRGQQQPPTIALPVVHCEATFRRPVHSGDRLDVTLQPTRLNPGSFEVRCTFQHKRYIVAQGLIRHVAIEAISRQRCALPEDIDRWLEASCLGTIASL